MYIEIHNYEECKQDALYYKLNSAFSLDSESGLSEKIKGVYAIYNKDTCLYVGQSKNIASRIATHLRGKYETATDVFMWNVEHIGFSNFMDRQADNKKYILDNCEQYLMGKLKPIDNLLINMDKNIPLDEQPTICFESNADITMNIMKHSLVITDSYSYLIDEICVSIDYLDYSKQIDHASWVKTRSVISGIEQKGFHQLGIKND